MERPEQTQLEDLSDASFLDMLLVLPANVRLDWNVIARYKCSSLFGLVICNEEKKSFITLTTGRAVRPRPHLVEVCGVPPTLPDCRTPDH
jgi:hypothetical protein